MRDDIARAVELIDVYDLPAPVSFVGMVAWTHQIAVKERTLARLTDDIVREQAYHALQVRFASRVIATALDTNLEKIKKKLWHPDGRLVGRMVLRAAATE
jgi:hypothetical protein